METTDDVYLLQTATITRIIAHLNGTAQDALRALLAAAGPLPVHTFEAPFAPTALFC